MLALDHPVRPRLHRLRGRRTRRGDLSLFAGRPNHRGRRRSAVSRRGRTDGPGAPWRPAGGLAEGSLALPHLGRLPALERAGLHGLREGRHPQPGSARGKRPRLRSRVRARLLHRAGHPAPAHGQVRLGAHAQRRARDKALGAGASPGGIRLQTRGALQGDRVPLPVQPEERLGPGLPGVDHRPRRAPPVRASETRSTAPTRSPGRPSAG